MEPFFYGFADELIKMSTDAKSALEETYGIKLVGSWKPQELNELHKILFKLPPALVRDNPKLRVIGRAAKLINGPPNAPGHSMYKPDHPKHGQHRATLVVFDKGVYDSGGRLDPTIFGKSILHELSHSFDKDLPEAFGRPPFITGYAAASPKEDWAESFAEYFLRRELLEKKSPQKAHAISEFIGGLT